MKFKKRYLQYILSLVCVIIAVLIPQTVFAKDGTDGTELQVMEPEKLEVQLGVDWAGTEFQLKTDAGLYPGTITVDQDGVLRLEIGGSKSYVLSCKEDVQRAIRIGACNVYHMCVHNLVHERSADILKGLYKSAVFTLQAIAFLQTGSYKKKKTDLLPLLQEKDQNILRTSIELKEKNSLSFEEILQFSDLLLNWSSKWIREVR